MIILKLAWRNIWRNKRRTGITLASIFFAVILSSLMMSVKEGTYDRMIDASVGAFMGYGQVHANGYWEEKSLDWSFELNNELKEKLESQAGITNYIPRIESFALAAGEEMTKGAMVVGIDVEKESKLNALHERVTDGEYLSEGENAILVGDGLSKYLKLEVGDTLVLLGQGYHGSSAAGKYPIKGLIKFGNPTLSKQLVFLPIDACKQLYGMEGTITNLILQFKDNDKSQEVTQQLASSLGDEFEVMHWSKTNEEIVEMIEADRVEGYVFMFILYMVIGFGIFGTTLMMLAERRHEFGVLVAIGMKRFQLAILVWMEVMILSIMGSFLGMFGAYPICYYLWANPVQLTGDMSDMTEEYGMEPVFQASIDLSVFSQQAIVVAIVASFIAIYPLVKLTRVRAIDQMRS